MSSILWSLALLVIIVYFIAGIMEKYEGWKTWRRINQMTDEEFRQSMIDEIMVKFGKWKG